MSAASLPQRVLLAEDSHSQITYIRKILASHFPGLELIPCGTGKEALDKLKKDRFSLVVMSYRLPDLSGLELLKRIRKEAPSLPIIMMTAEVSSGVILEVMREGAYDYIAKTKEGLRMLPVVAAKGLEKHRLTKEKEAFQAERERLIHELKETNHELIKTQEDLVKAERMAAIGLLSMTVSHEINNPLTSVMGFSELLAKRKDLPEDVHRKILKIYENSLRIQDIVQKLIQLTEEKSTEVGNVPILDLHGKEPR